MATNEAVILDSVTSPLAINDGTTYTLEALDMSPPKKRGEWVSGADADGEILARDPLFENRTITARIRIEPQSTANLMLDKIGAIVDKLEEAERLENGLPCTWAPADSTSRTYTFYVLSGEVTEMPIMVSGDGAGWFVRAPIITVTMQARPFLYGAEVTQFAAASSTLPLYTVELTSVAGDMPAEGRLIITDAATQGRRLFRWGLESRFYPTSSPPGLIIDSDSFVTSGFAGTGTTRSGAYDPGAAGNSVVRGTLATQPIAICGTGNQTHVGTFRVFARVVTSAANTGSVQVRLAWQDGEGPWRYNTYTTPPMVVSYWTEVDLGQITITETPLGTQRWQGRIDAYSSVVDETLDIDYLLLIPSNEGYGTALAAATTSAGILTGRDEFTAMTAGTALNARVAPAGGTWATSGSATDLTAADAPGTLETMSRATVSDASRRLAILGASNYTNTDVSIDFYATTIPGVGFFFTGPIARYVDANNYFFLVLGTSYSYISLVKRVAGSETSLGSTSITSPAINTWYRARVVIAASGVGYATLSQADSGTELARLDFSDTALATGGALATGKPGFYDFNSGSSAGTRYYDTFASATPDAEPIVVNSGRRLEVRSDGAIREDSTGTYWGPVPSYRGTRFVVPPAGTRSRKARIAVMARRNNTTLAPDDQIADNLTVAVNVTPRYLAVPR